MGSNSTKEKGEYWRPDDSASTCELCDGKFTFFNRRHHCRACGGLFCDNCSKGKTFIPDVNLHNLVRVCNNCSLRLGGGLSDGDSTPRGMTPRGSTLTRNVRSSFNNDRRRGDSYVLRRGGSPEDSLGGSIVAGGLDGSFGSQVSPNRHTLRAGGRRDVISSAPTTPRAGAIDGPTTPRGGTGPGLDDPPQQQQLSGGGVLGDRRSTNLQRYGKKGSSAAVVSRGAKTGTVNPLRRRNLLLFLCMSYARTREVKEEAQLLAHLRRNTEAGGASTSSPDIQYGPVMGVMIPKSVGELMLSFLGQFTFIESVANPMPTGVLHIARHKCHANFGLGILPTGNHSNNPAASAEKMPREFSTESFDSSTVVSPVTVPTPSQQNFLISASPQSLVPPAPRLLRQTAVYMAPSLPSSSTYNFYYLLTISPTSHLELQVGLVHQTMIQAYNSDASSSKAGGGGMGGAGAGGGAEGKNLRVLDLCTEGKTNLPAKAKRIPPVGARLLPYFSDFSDSDFTPICLPSAGNAGAASVRGVDGNEDAAAPAATTGDGQQQQQQQTALPMTCAPVLQTSSMHLAVHYDGQSRSMTVVTSDPQPLAPGEVIDFRKGSKLARVNNSSVASTGSATRKSRDSLTRGITSGRSAEEGLDALAGGSTADESLEREVIPERNAVQQLEQAEEVEQHFNSHTKVGGARSFNLPVGIAGKWYLSFSAESMGDVRLQVL